MVLPNFLIIGAMKAGTTSLYEYLRRRPDVFMPPTKELNFFVAERNWPKGLRWYQDQFEKAGDARAVGEATTHYTRFPQFKGVPERIAAVIPNVRLIYLLRDPVERMRSEYVYRRLGGWEHRTLTEAWTTDPTYIDGSRYSLQIEQYLGHFQMEQLLLLQAEKLRRDRLTALEKISEFLGLTAEWDDSFIHREFHQTSEQRMPNSLGVRLRRVAAYGWLGKHAPANFKQAYKKVATHEIDPDIAKVPGEVLGWALDALGPDIERLEKYLGDEQLSWNH